MALPAGAARCRLQHTPATAACGGRCGWQCRHPWGGHGLPAGAARGTISRGAAAACSGRHGWQWRHPHGWQPTTHSTAPSTGKHPMSAATSAGYSCRVVAVAQPPHVGGGWLLEGVVAMTDCTPPPPPGNQTHSAYATATSPAGDCSWSLQLASACPAWQPSFLHDQPSSQLFCHAWLSEQHLPNRTRTCTQ
jgi:hypothetical protein